MSTLQEYVSIIGGFQGCLLFVLLIADSRLNTASRILGFLCLLITSVFALPFLLINSDVDAVAWTAVFVFYLPAASGALAFLYCRSALLDQAPKARDLLHFIPWLSCYVLTASIFINDPQQMIAWITGTVAWTWRLEASEYLMFAQAFGYAVLTASMIWRYRRQANDTLANFNPSIFRWLLILQMFTIVIWLLKALPSFSKASIVFSDIANLLLVILVYLIALTQWRNPRLFTIPRLAEQQDGSMPDNPGVSREPQGGQLEPAMRGQLFETLTSQLEHRTLYLDSKLTLASLAEATGLNKHHLSEVLNRHAGKNFYEFVNSYRIAYVCRRLQEDASQKIIDIALDAGFSSKSTFNAIFKQFTGKTPTQYRRALDKKTV